MTEYKIRSYENYFHFFSKYWGYLLSISGINHRTRIFKEPVLIIKTQKNENFICEQRN